MLWGLYLLEPTCTYYHLFDAPNKYKYQSKPLQSPQSSNMVQTSRFFCICIILEVLFSACDIHGNLFSQYCVKVKSTCGQIILLLYFLGEKVNININIAHSSLVDSFKYELDKSWISKRFDTLYVY